MSIFLIFFGLFFWPFPPWFLAIFVFFAHGPRFHSANFGSKTFQIFLAVGLRFFSVFSDFFGRFFPTFSALVSGIFRHQNFFDFSENFPIFSEIVGFFAEKCQKNQKKCPKNTFFSSFFDRILGRKWSKKRRFASRQTPVFFCTEHPPP